MTSTELAAYLGAAAWVPQIATWVYRSVATPIITIVPERYAEVGFTSLGPLFNIRMAFASDRKDAIIDGFELALRHEQGDTRTLRWSGLNETFSEIQDAAGNRQVVSRDQIPIALKVGRESLVEKLVRFHDPHYDEAVRPLLANLVAHFNFLKRSDPEYVAKTLASKELYEVLDARQKAFWWRAGRYEVTLNLSSPRKFTLARSRYAFELTSLDVDQLRRNIETQRTDIESIIQSNLPDFQMQSINWNWTTVNIHPIMTK